MLTHAQRERYFEVIDHKFRHVFEKAVEDAILKEYKFHYEWLISPEKAINNQTAGEYFFKQYHNHMEPHKKAIFTHFFSHHEEQQHKEEYTKFNDEIFGIIVKTMKETIEIYGPKVTGLKLRTAVVQKLAEIDHDIEQHVTKEMSQQGQQEAMYKQLAEIAKANNTTPEELIRLAKEKHEKK